MEIMEIAALLKCWERTREHHEFNPPATEEELVSVEQELRRKLPESFRKLYRFSNGFSLSGGNFQLYPLRMMDSDLSLVAVTPFLREAGWQIPEQVLIFGDSG